MTHPFVPLAPGALRAADPSAVTRTKPASSAEAQPLFQPKNLPKPSPAAETNGAAHAAHGTPTITLERQGETITHIRVQCACGQVIELKCSY